MEIKALQPCKLLNGIEPDKRVSREGLDQSWFWQLRHNAKTAKTYEVNEGGISSVEFRLIRAWLDEVLISLSNEKKEGDDSPNTAIPEVLYWLCASFPYF